MKLTGTSKRYDILVYLVIILIVGLFACGHEQTKIEKLSERGIVTQATVVKANTATRGKFKIYYRFMAAGIEIKDDTTRYDLYSTVAPLLENKSFPVIYLEEDPQNNYLLVSPRDFSGMGKAFPDSLGWVKPYQH